MRNTQEQKAETTKYEEGQRWYRAQSWCLCVSKTCLQTASQGLYCYYDQEYQVAVAVAAADTTTWDGQFPAQTFPVELQC
jgi:hypothetical protein